MLETTATYLIAAENSGVHDHKIGSALLCVFVA
jgi:hypothetical protein